MKIIFCGKRVKGQSILEVLIKNGKFYLVDGRQKKELSENTDAECVLVTRDGFEKNIGDFCKHVVPIVRHPKMPGMDGISRIVNPDRLPRSEYMEFFYYKTEYENEKLIHYYKER